MENDIQAWPRRPWILAAFLAVTGFIFYLIVEEKIFAPDDIQFRSALATFVLVSAVSFAFTLERIRYSWIVAFSVLWGCILAFVIHSTAFSSYTGRFDLSFSFCSGLLAAGIALPLFQTIHQYGRIALPYKALHGNAWNDVVCWCASWAFVGLSFVLAHLLASLFNLVGISLLKELLREEWFVFSFIGAAFGAALGVLKENNGIISSLKSLVMTILSILAPVLCISLMLFLVSLPFTGLESLWSATKGTTPILLSCAAGAIILINAIIRNDNSEESSNRVMRYSAIGLVICTLPLTVIAFLSMMQRIEQYGFTPDRIWGLVTVLIAMFYGLGYLFSFLKTRDKWTSNLRHNNIRLAILLCVVTLFLALPVIDFAKISVNSQLTRIQKGDMQVEDIDFVAFAFDFGDVGREALKSMQNSENELIASRASIALGADKRWQLKRQINQDKSAISVARKLVVFPESVPIPKSLEKLMNQRSACLSEYCLLVWEPEMDTAQLISSNCNFNEFAEADITSKNNAYQHCPPSVDYFYKGESGWALLTRYNRRNKVTSNEKSKEKLTISNAITKGEVEVRTIERKQLFIGGKPVSQPY